MRKHYTLLFAAMLTLRAASGQSGVPDPDYGNAGIVILQPGDLHDVAYDIMALDDNSSLICGVARIEGSNAIFLAHLLEDGSLDEAFGTDEGYTFISIGEEAYGYAMGRDSEGRIYVAGTAYPTFAQSVVAVVRTDANGQPDGSYGTDGVLTIPVGSGDAVIDGLAIAGDDHVVLAGSAIGDDFIRDAMLMRITPQGELDAGFGNGGIAILDDLSSESKLNDLALLDDGSILGVGYATSGFEYRSLAWMVDATGLPVAQFGSNGVALLTIGTNGSVAHGMAVRGTDIYVTGAAIGNGDDDIYVARLRDNGNFSPLFNGGSPRLIDLNDMELGLDAAIGVGGNIIICGTTGAPGFASPRDFFVARLTSSGDLVQSFGTDGVAVTSIQPDFDDANAVAMQADGKIITAGFTSGFSAQTDNDAAVVRYAVDWVLGEQASIQRHGLLVWPNPCAGAALSVAHGATGAVEARLVDAAGRVARTEVRTCDPITLDMTGVADGRYVLELRSDAGIQRTCVMVQR